MSKRIECSCNQSFIVIDSRNTSVTCGIRGVLDLQNVRILRGVAYCTVCNKIVFEQETENTKGEQRGAY